MSKSIQIVDNKRFMNHTWDGNRLYSPDGDELGITAKQQELLVTRYGGPTGINLSSQNVLLLLGAALIVLVVILKLTTIIVSPSVSTQPQTIYVQAQPQGQPQVQVIQDTAAIQMAQNNIDGLKTQLGQREAELQVARDEINRNASSSATDKARISQMETEQAAMRQRIATLETELAEAKKGVLQKVGESIFGK